MTTSFVASVVFLRIPDFPRRPASEQARLRAQLEAVVAVTMAELDPAGCVVLDASDGLAIVVLRDPAGALRLGERALNAAVAGLPLCAGINHGAVRLLGNGRGDSMVGDGIAVAASVAQFAPLAELRTSRAFREALADAEPGMESILVPRGASTDASLRSHELFAPERAARERRKRRFAAYSVVAVVAFLAAGIGARISAQGQEAFMEELAMKYRNTTLQSERYVRSLVQKVSFQ